jgi:peptidoglycan hydrolase-like protein with peptidoglycan-binding domain
MKTIHYAIGGVAVAAVAAYFFWPKKAVASTTAGATPAAAALLKSQGASPTAQPVPQTAKAPAAATPAPAVPAVPGLPTFSVPSYDMSVASAQNALKALGYNPGPVDGVFGPATAAALKQFQTAQNLPQTAVIDANTVQALLAAATI